MKQINECLHTFAKQGEENLQNNHEGNTSKVKNEKEVAETLPFQKTAHKAEVTKQPSKKAKLSPFAWFKIGHVSKQKTDSNIAVAKPLKQRVNEEIERYNTKCSYFIPEEDAFDLLSWWKENATEFPILSDIAQSLFVINASSAE